MNIFGLTITRTKAAPPQLLAPVSSRGLWGGGWTNIIREPYSGAWQRNVVINQQDVLTYSTVWACITLIASDVAKLPLKLVQRDADGIWSDVENPAYSPLLRKPNHYQTSVKFLEYWQLSRLIHGNTYALKARDARGVVSALYILDPTRVKPLVAPDGSVFYQLSSDVLSGLEANGFVVPASEIIHDMHVPLFHPLVGVSPIFACGLAATQGLKIQNSSTDLFGKGSQLSGILSFPGMLSEEAMQKFAKYWEENYTGEHNVGKVAIVSGGMKFEPMTMTATDAQLIEQLKWTAEQVCAAFHVPGYMVGIGPAPPYTDIQSINLQYYAQALQNPIANFQQLIDEGLELRNDLGVMLDLDDLHLMDSKTQMETAVAGVGGGILTPNEARRRFDKKPLTGGDTVYLQQQDYSIEAINRRDTQAPAPSSTAPTAPTSTPIPTKQLSQLELRMYLKAAVMERLKRAA